MNISFSCLDKNCIWSYMPKLYNILHANMSIIAPTGNTYEEDYISWSKANAEEIKSPQRGIILIHANNEIVGFFKYSIPSNEVFFMEEIQISIEYQQRYGIFRLLYLYMAKILPDSIEYVYAYSNKRNLKSQAILQKLGLVIIEERKKKFLN